MTLSLNKFLGKEEQVKSFATHFSIEGIVTISMDQDTSRFVERENLTEQPNRAKSEATSSPMSQY